MTDRFHSRSFALLRRFSDDLHNATWPPHPTTGHTPIVNPVRPGETAEGIEVVYVVDDDATVEWATISPGLREERLRVDVFVWSRIPGANRDEDYPATWSRLEELADTVQGVYYDLVDGAVIPDVGGVLPIGGLLRVTPRLYATDEGWEGQCTVTFQFAFRT